MPVSYKPKNIKKSSKSYKSSSKKLKRNKKSKKGKKNRQMKGGTKDPNPYTDPNPTCNKFDVVTNQFGQQNVGKYVTFKITFNGISDNSETPEGEGNIIIKLTEGDKTKYDIQDGDGFPTIFNKKKNEVIFANDGKSVTFTITLNGTISDNYNEYNEDETYNEYINIKLTDEDKQKYKLDSREYKFPSNFNVKTNNVQFINTLCPRTTPVNSKIVKPTHVTSNIVKPKNTNKPSTNTSTIVESDF